MNPKESALRDLLTSVVAVLGTWGVEVSDGTQAVVTGVLTGVFVTGGALAHYFQSKAKRFGR